MSEERLEPIKGKWCGDFDIEKCIFCKKKCFLFPEIEKSMMHIWYQEDAVELDLTTEEIIAQLSAENEMLYRVIKKLQEQGGVR